MEVVFAFCCVDIRVACVFLFRALMMGFKRAGAAFMLGEAHYRVLWNGNILLVEK
jgi:hypothetical protein